MGDLLRYLGPLMPWIVLATLGAIVVIVLSGWWPALRPWGNLLAFAPLALAMISQQLAIHLAITTAHEAAVFNLEIMDDLFGHVGRPDICGASLTVFCPLLNWGVGRGGRPRSVGETVR